MNAVREQERHAPVLGTVTAATMCIAAPVALWWAVPDLNQWRLEAPAVTVMLLSGARFAWILASGRVRPFEIMAWLYCYVFLGVAPLVQLRTVTSPDTTPDLDVHHVGTAFGMVLAGSVALLLGSALHRVWGPRAQPAPRTIRLKRLLLLAAGSTLACGLTVMRLGGPQALLMTRAERSEAVGDDAGATLDTVLFAAASMGLLVTVIACIQRLRGTGDTTERRRLTALALGAAAPLLLLVNPIGAPRYVVGVCYLGILNALGLQATLRRFRAVSVGLLVGLVVVFPIADSFRNSLNAGVEEVNPLRALTEPDFDSFAQLVNTAEYVDDRGHTEFRQILGAALFAAPRALWPDKPVDTGIELANFKGYTFTNLSAPLWAEFFIDGGWVWLVLGLGGVGFLLADLDRRQQFALARLGMPGILGAAVPVYQLIVLRGSLLQSMASLLVLALCAAFVSSRTKEPA